MIELSDLKRCSIRVLENIYENEGAADVPQGVYKGTHLGWIEDNINHRQLLKSGIFLGFKLAPYGIDFDRKRWFFINKNARIGHFRAETERSRWRDTDAVCLHYESSRLPRMIRSHLYDEVKPLTDSLCLGVGGINKPDGGGDIFYFALTRIG